MTEVIVTGKRSILARRLTLNKKLKGMHLRLFEQKQEMNTS